MSNIKDMESLLLEIKSSSIKEYMREALSCYNVSAYKACISLSFNALIYDLLEKTRLISDINPLAKSIVTEVDRRIKGNGSYESYLIDNLASNGFLTTIEKDQAESFLKLRHKCSHPSGFHPSAENARFVYHDIIYIFLSKERLLTKARVDEIIWALDDKFYFPSRVLSSVTSLVENELSNVHDDALPYLIDKLVKGCEEGSEFKSRFIVGMAALDKEKINIILMKIIERRLSNEKLSSMFIQIFNANDKLFKGIGITNVMRLVKVIGHEIYEMQADLPIIKYKNPVKVLFKIADDWQGEELYKKLLKDPSTRTAFKNLDYMPEFFMNLTGDFRKLLLESFIDRGIANAKVDESNIHMRCLLDDEDSIVEHLHNDEIIRICCAIIVRSRSGSSRAKRAISNKFSGYESFKSRLDEAVKSECVEDLIKDYDVELVEIEKIFIE